MIDVVYCFLCKRFENGVNIRYSGTNKCLANLILRLFYFNKDLCFASTRAIGKDQRILIKPVNRISIRQCLRFFVEDQQRFTSKFIKEIFVVSRLFLVQNPGALLPLTFFLK